MLYYHSVSGSWIDKGIHSVSIEVGIYENSDLLKQKLDVGL